jgi:hypothetical protein
MTDLKYGNIGIICDRGLETGFLPIFVDTKPQIS